MRVGARGRKAIHIELAREVKGSAEKRAEESARMQERKAMRDEFMNSRMPAASLPDLQQGDAVMIVTTDAPADQQVIALTLLSGVEPILTAAPTQASAANLLSGWSMGSDAEGGNQ